MSLLIKIEIPERIAKEKISFDSKVYQISD
jgi:hypothetical protein